MEQHNRVCATVDLDAIAYNMEQMRKRIGEDARLIVVVKTDGYGHGAVPVAEMLEEFPYVWGYAVACLEEGIELKRHGIEKPVMVPTNMQRWSAMTSGPLSIWKRWRRQYPQRQKSRVRLRICISRLTLEWAGWAFP